MSTAHAERRTRRHLAGTLLALAVVAGCSQDERPSEQATPPAEVQPELGSQVAKVLRTRAAAVVSGDLPAFLDTVDQARGRLVRREERYFLNLRDLPLRRFGYALQGVVPVEDGSGTVKAVVEVRMQLDGYDAAPVRTPRALTFRPGGEFGLVMVDDRDEQFDRDHDIEPQPWDLTRIEVESGDGVLGIFDRGSVDEAYQIIPAVEEGIAEVARRVPVEWDGRVVVYALSDVRVLASIDDLPGGDPDRLDGVAFPVRVSPDSPRLAGTRFMLHPRMIERDSATRRRLIRHELTHVALGRRDDTVPTWLAEGIAEWVSVQALQPHERLISAEALRTARGGLTALPADEDFNGPHSGANYGIAWFAVEYVAAAYGEKAVWALLDAMRANGGTSYDEQDAVLEAVLGIDSAELARRAGRKILTTYR